MAILRSLVFLDSLVILGACLIAVPRAAYAAKNLFNNGNFQRGSGNSVDGWRTDGWIQTSGTTDYLWISPQNGEPGQIELVSHSENDARWVQQVSLRGGWYYISAEAKTHDALPFKYGANVSVLEDSITSATLTGDHDWQRVGLYLKIGRHGADVDIALRLGGYASLTRGEAFFRDARVVQVAGPPPGAPYVYDLSAIRKQEMPPPIGQPWSLVATFAFLAACAAAGWWMMQAPVPVRAQSVRAERRRASRKARRRA
jgi:hypothetical protein